MDNKNAIKIGTFNVRSLSSTERYIQLTYALENIKFDILGLSEVRRLGCNIEEYDDYILCYIGETKGLHGVGFLLNKKFKENIHDFTGISERVALLQLKLEQVTISIIQAYAPTETSQEEEVQTFYNDMEKAHLLAGNNLIVMGDFNAKIGHPKSEESLCMGRYGYGQRNQRGQQLIDYAIEHQLCIMNTFFKKKQNRKWTWMSPNQKVKNEIDFIMTNQPHMISNIEILNQISFASDHRLLRATLTMYPRTKSRRNFKNSTTNLKTENEIKIYTNNLKDNLKDTNLIKNVQIYYNSLEKHIKDSLQSDPKIEKKKNRILSDHTINLIKKRSELILSKNKTKQQKKELTQLFKTTNKSIKLDYNKHREEIITRNLNTNRSAKRAYKELTLQKKWIQKLKYETNETKTRKDVIDHATEFYRELYSKKGKEIQYYGHNSEDKYSIEPIREGEVYSQIKKLKNEKSPGPDGLTNESLKLGAPFLLKHLTKLFNMILDTETIPKQWCSSDIVLIYKKGNPLELSNYRPISLLPSAYKLFSSIILNRIANKINLTQPVEQAGFCSGFSTIDHIHTVEQLIQKYEEYNMPLYIACIDYSKAFDSISHNSIWNALRTSNVEDKYINIIKCIYSNSTSKWAKYGINIDGRRLTHLRFADDIILFSETAKQLQEMLRELDKESSKVGLQLNRNRCFSKAGDLIPLAYSVSLPIFALRSLILSSNRLCHQGACGFMVFRLMSLIRAPLNLAEVYAAQ
ncbi:unnamed protein product [Colias eurytheme]|nr:unnamed protein product [Colias eurytheme]